MARTAVPKPQKFSAQDSSGTGKSVAVVEKSDKWLTMAKDAYEASSAFLDTNYRADLDYSLRAFRNEHASGSKYLSPEFSARSRIFRPKTRSIIRKNEAAGMQAMFSNREFISVEAENPDDPVNVASAACLKEVVDYRFKKTIPAFEIYLGGLQDAQTTGAVVSYQYWEYLVAKDGRKLKDQPCIELRPIENIRLDGGASWLDPVGTSPYFCDIIPMYVCDVRAMMRNKDDKTGAPKWKNFEDSVILQARPDVMNAKRVDRTGKSQMPEDEPTGIKSFDIVWVMRWFMKGDQADDNVFYTLGTTARLSEAKPIDEVYFHGKRPYVMGCAVLETHKVFKTPMPMLIKPLQQETNDIANQRIDNVKFVLNKRWLVARGRQTDVQSLVRNVPGGVTLTADPNTDIKESNWPDVTSSSYVEQDRLNADIDDLAGNFSPSTKVANNAVNDTLGGSKMAAAGAGLMTEYLLRTVNETWWEKVARQVVMLEQYYETDDVILGICAQKAKLFPRFGISQVSDSLLMKEVNVSVDASMGDPNQRMQKFNMATQMAIGVVNNAPPSMNVQEVIAEIYSNAGYRTGARFWNSQVDPRLAKAMQAMQQMRAALEGKQMEIQAGQQTEAAKLASNERIKSAELQVDAQRISGDLKIREAELMVEQQKLELEKLKLQVEASGMGEEMKLKIAELTTKVEEARIKLEHERVKIEAKNADIAHQMQTRERETQAVESNEARVGGVAEQVSQSMQSVAGEVDNLKSGLAAANSALSGMAELGRKVDVLGQGFGAMAGMMSAPKRKAKGFKMKKGADKRTSAVIVEFDDGTMEEMPVGSTQ